MQSPVEQIKLRVTTRELMDIKDAYTLFDTKSAIKFLFDQQHPTKELLLDQGFDADPCHINGDVVVFTVKARVRCG